MKKPDEYCEFDDYDFSDIPRNPNPITKEEEDRLIAEMVARVKKRKAEQDARKAQRSMETNS